MNELIATQESESGDILVSGRELHEFLEVNSNYTTWFNRMTGYGFEEGSDFIPIMEESRGGRPSQDHHLKLDMAKEISMLQRTDKGKQARQYFLQLEKLWNSPEAVMRRALQYADQKVTELEQKMQLDKPKVMFADAVETSTSSVLVGELSKVLKQNGVEIGQNRLFKWLRGNGYLIKQNGESYNLPTQRSMDKELFEIKKRTINNPDGSIRTTRTPKVTGKGQVYFVNKFLEDQPHAT
ncbi:phage antirepressor KilAC domain-containing protein [Salicibibacter cibarius]|uniref:Phage antirepressor KilAC domain-containing protein n=1 Tax=Salicibibacter cibarius TaxID=2743000 RepID=A0A7T7CAM5_9BACI|nr:phage antirepressor KilAC domain-containing protein [Salicibibacter cibarius]QQK75059.1 phage antirepressor KilAC domain-containing protein [Salicibibacter cibarius]QQK75121.1 phage antirepressor KilAC domain-containing protein [Salicibibacter cibarius]